MSNLFWKRKTGDTLNLLSVPYKSEEEFERAVFETRGLLQDVHPLRRQVRGGRKPGIPDILGIDSDGNVCVIEMKNVAVDEGMIPQVLQYAFWAESNPDSIKSLCLEAPEPPENIDFENYEVRIIVIAPSIDPSTLKLVAKINYQVDLVEIKRWVEDGEEFLLVNQLVAESAAKVRPVRGLPVYDREFYEARYNKASVQQFHSYVEQTKALVQRSGWPLEPKFNKHYCGFKHGFFNAFGIKWTGSKSLAFFFKLPESVARSLAPAGTEMTKYDEQWKEAVFRIAPGETAVEPFGPLFRAAVETLTGEKSG